MKLSILIVNWNTRDLTVKCLNSIIKYAPLFPYEVIIVDNGSKDGSAAAIANLFGHNRKVRLLQSVRNLGFARANNLAYRESMGEFIMLLNPDTEVTGLALEKLVAYLESHQDVGVVGAKLINPDGSVQHSVRKFPGLWSSLCMFSGLHRFFPPRGYLMEGFDYEQEADVDQVMGAALMTRRALVKEIGFLDENFWLWYEEVDFCLRAKNFGYAVRFFPAVQVIHHLGQSFSQVPTYERKRTMARSLVYYFKKNGHLHDVILIRMAIPVVLFSAWVLNRFESILKFKLKTRVS